ncbi:hypothetical protein GCM10027278_02840 [Paralcaligenes ginsengisoli]
MIPSECRPVKKSSLFNRLVDLSGMSVGVATFLIGIFVTYDVLARTLFRMTNSWVTEVTTYLMGYITFVGAAYVLKEGAHVSVDLLVQKMPPTARRVLVFVTDGIMLLVVATLAWLSFQFFWDAWTSHEVSDTLLSISLWIPYLSFFIGMVWLLAVLVTQTLRHWRR